MNNLDEPQILEVENQYWVDMAASLERLHSNPDFLKVILIGYFQDKAINGVSLLAQDSVVESGRRSAVMEDLIAVSSLQDHFITIRNLGTVSVDDSEE
jgi:hypothetical protein